MLEVAPGFWNIRGKLKMILGLVDVGTHMSLMRLSSGKFLVLDTVEVAPPLKEKLDKLTDNGRLIEAVLATHPFHTLFFPPFFDLYPGTQVYGTPRHLRKFPHLPWAGSVLDVLGRWEPEVSMRIPDGAEFDAPAEANHFSSVVVLHRPSRTVHVDDTIMFYENPGLALRLACCRPGSMTFHPTMLTVGLHPTAEAPLQFKAWVERLLEDWDFDNICTAHMGNRIGGAKAKLQETLAAATPALEGLADKRRGETEPERRPKGQSSGPPCG